MSALTDPFHLPYMARALTELVVLGGAGGVVGTFVMLRRLAYVADALTHTVFPGVVIGFAVGAADGVFWGALLAGLATAVLLTGLTRAPRVSDDTALTVLLTAMFGLGVILVTRQHDYHHDLTAFLFGQVLTVTWADVLQSSLLAAGCLLALSFLGPHLTLRAFDPEGARAMGYRTGLLDLALNVVIALVVVAAVRSVGTVLVIALLILPAAFGRALSHRVPVIAAAGAAFGALCGWLGLAAGYHASVGYGLPLAAGPAVVLLMASGYALALGGTAMRKAHRA
ncbi:metal ABC transporter permease [Streptomyces sp. DSM 42041]|uniref:High-affinity zinc uptake system membrane protein ZnuB n=1 Tax=Streptomyces hazeniae TaxID=3075538 RepID=A0ABU2P0L6_9ACTN|nr:metal ABC transporter permease [Streptomyces sp. DSM 42041]MDT0382282.1 metal ABC transporter permease [Streptomyces sp. DSM 42041]